MSEFVDSNSAAVATHIELPGADVTLVPSALPFELAQRLWDALSTQFRNEVRKSYHGIKLGRKTLVLVDNNEVHLASSIPAIWGGDVTILPFSDDVRALREIVRQHTGTATCFNICLANYYNTGNESIGWHSDVEERGETSCIASVSLGATRPFEFRRIPSSISTDEPVLATVELKHASLLVMGKGCQEHYQHRLPRCKGLSSPRLNLTLRRFDAAQYTVASADKARNSASIYN